MRRIKSILKLSVLASGTIIFGLLAVSVREKVRQVHVQAFDSSRQSHMRFNGSDTPINFFQPTEEELKALGEGIVFLSDFDEDEYVEIGSKLALVNEIPYHRYWQLDRDDAYAFHPSHLGGVLTTLAISDLDLLSNVYHRALEFSIVLPNGGRTWYYPEVYPINRMAGPMIQYSALSQGSLLSAAMHMRESGGEEYSHFLDSIAKGMILDYHEGGVLWQEEIFLELPIYYSPPEVILNGWIDALLSYSDYVEHYPSEENRKIFEASTTAMAEMLGQFDDRDRRLSLYSNTTPLRVFLDKSEPEQSFEIDFLSRREPFPDYEIELLEIDQIMFGGESQYSSFNTQILHDNGSTVTATLSCNQNYDTIVSSEHPFDVRFSTGVYDNGRAAPAVGGENIHLESIQRDGLFVLHLDENRDRLFCGYPTNFAKTGGENFYHQYHIVGLLYLASGANISEEVKERFLEYANLWMEYTDIRENEGLTFTPYQNVLDSINSHKFDVTVENWDELLYWAQSQS